LQPDLVSRLEIFFTLLVKKFLIVILEKQADSPLFEATPNRRIVVYIDGSNQIMGAIVSSQAVRYENEELSLGVA
jgi:hypothetical protein